MGNKIEKDINDMTRNEAKEDFYNLLSEDETALLLEYLYTSVATFWSTCEDEQFLKDINWYYAKCRNLHTRTITERLYIYTNEHLKKLFSEIDVKDKKVATVGSSGDQALNAIYKGAKQVDLIDANILTRPFVELKIAAIKGLEYDEYFDFIVNLVDIRTNKYFKYYAKISHYLPDSMRMFWDNIMINEEGMQERFFRGLFHEDEIIFKDISVFHCASKFDEMKTILNDGEYKLNYIVAEFEDFPKKLKEKYDFILLSNIVDYFADYHFEDYIDIISRLYQVNLNEGGSLQLTSSIRCRTLDRFRSFITKSKAIEKRYEACGLYGNNTLFMQKPKSDENVRKKIIYNV